MFRQNRKWPTRKVGCVWGIGYYEGSAVHTRGGVMCHTLSADKLVGAELVDQQSSWLKYGAPKQHQQRVGEHS